MVFFVVRLMYDGNEHQFKWNEINIEIFFEHVILNPLNRNGAYNAYNNIRFSIFFPIKIILIHNMLFARDDSISGATVCDWFYIESLEAKQKKIYQ